MQTLTIGNLLDTSRTLVAPLLDGCRYPWEALPGLRDFIIAFGATLDPSEYDHPSDGVWIARTAAVAPTASISGPAVVCAGAEIRHCAFIRGSVIVGAGAVVGNSCELKNCILFDLAQVPHFNYVGDSIIGHLAHLGAGAITSNVKSDKTLVTVHNGSVDIETGLKKFGAIVGDMAEVGSGCVLNPGTVVGRNSNIYPLTSVRGVVPPGHIMKGNGNMVKKR